MNASSHVFSTLHVCGLFYIEMSVEFVTVFKDWLKSVAPVIRILTKIEDNGECKTSLKVKFRKGVNKLHMFNTVKHEIYWNCILKFSYGLTENTACLLRKINQLMLYTKVIGIYCDNCTGHKYTLGKRQEFWGSKQYMQLPWCFKGLRRNCSLTYFHW